METLEFLAPYLDYLQAYMPQVTMAGLLTFLVLGRLPTDWYMNLNANLQFWVASGLGALSTVAVMLLSIDVIPTAELPGRLGEWAFLVVLGGIGPKVFYQIAETYEGILGRIKRE